MINKKKIFGFFTIASVMGFLCKPSPPEMPSSETDFYKLQIKSIDGNAIDLSAYQGKKILCVNVASFCGYTPQYADLQKLYEKYQDRLVVIGFPCNQFGGQEPDSSQQIKTFCSTTYHVSFPLTEKIEVKGKNQHPIYQWLTQKKLNGQADYEVKWNFNKFLVDENGNFVAYFPSKTAPLDSAITKLIEK